jgi:hypothetical protein
VVNGIIHGVRGRAFFSVGKTGDLGRLLGVHVLLEHDAELVAQGLELSQVLLVLALVLDLGLDSCIECQSRCCAVAGSIGAENISRIGLGRTLENANGGREVVDPPGGPESSGEDGGGGNEIVGEGVVQVALWWKFESAEAGHEVGHRTTTGKVGGIPGAQKRPGHSQTPSRTYPGTNNQQLERRQ